MSSLRIRRSPGERLLPLIGIVALLVVWELAVRALDIPRYVLPAPTEVVGALAGNAALLAEHGWVTGYEMVAGYLLAIAVGIPLAMAITASRRFDLLVMPLLLLSQTIPKIAVAPLFLIWFGVGMLPKVLVAFLICFFPIVIDTAVGLRSVSPEMLDLARSMGATRGQVFAKIRLPSSLPYMFSGLKVAATLAVVGAIVGEFVGADRGLGYLLLLANAQLDTALLFAAIVVLTVIGMLLYYAVRLAEKMLLPAPLALRHGPEHGTL